MKHALTVLILLSACGDNATLLRATDYDGTCNAPADCSIIQVGACTDACGPPTDYAAINTKDAQRALEDYKALDCPKGKEVCNPGEPPTGVTCNNNHCGLKY
jgi:hypothetical protein